MQNFTGTGFSNDEIKKEDIVKQIKSKREAMKALDDIIGKHFGRAVGQVYRQGLKKETFDVKKPLDDLIKTIQQLRKYLQDMPHD